MFLRERGPETVLHAAAEQPAVRRIRAGEHGGLRALRLLALEDAAEAFSQTLEHAQQQPATYWQRLAAEGSAGESRVTFVAELKPEWVGMAGGQLDDERSARLVAMWVHPAHRRRRTGLALVSAVRDWSRWKGRTRLTLWVAESNETAIAFYSRAGFSPTGRRQLLPWSRDLSEIEMAEEL